MEEKNELQRLTELFTDCLNRCQHCHGEPFWCEECEANKAEYLDIVTNLLSGLEPYTRLMVILNYCVL